jgi:hypothetical protein
MAKAIAPYSGAPVLHGEVVDPRIADVEAVARWLDYVFQLPGGFRYGLSGIIGLIPGIGDILDAILSVYIILRAVQVGIPRVTIARMIVNVGIEAVGGALPFVGAVFNTIFKANRRQKTRDWLFLIVAGLLVVAGAVLPVIVIIELVKHI